MRPIFDVLIYEQGCEDYDTEGLCGPLYPISCLHTEGAGDENRLTLVHPYDPDGKWTTLAPGRTLKAWVLMHTPPEISDLGSVVTSVEVWHVSATATKKQRRVYSKRSGGKVLKTLSVGQQVIVTQAPLSGRYAVRTSSATGWMDPAGLEYETREVIPDTPRGMETLIGVSIRPQLFDIDIVERGDEGVTVEARHVFYRLQKNITNFYATVPVTPQEVGRTLLASSFQQTEFEFYSDLADTRTGLYWSVINPVKAMMDPEDGMMARWSCELLRDNFGIYMLSRIGGDRGVCIEAGSNLAGVAVTEDWSGVATHIIPRGQQSNGNPLYLPETAIVSDHAESYPYAMYYVLDCEDCKVGTNGVTTQIAYARMREQAQALLDSGCDLPTVSVTAEVAQGSAPENTTVMELLQPLPIYDIVTVVVPDRGISIKDRIVRRVWDCLTGRVVGVELGALSSVVGTATVPSWSLGGVDGAKIILGSLGAGSLGDGAIAARHVQADSINADALQAGSVTAGKLAAGSVTAEKADIGSLQAAIVNAIKLRAEAISAGDITTDELTAMTAEILDASIRKVDAGTIRTDALTAAAAEIVALTVEGITAQTITTDRLAAALADFVTLDAGTADFSLATIQNLLANALILQAGYAGRMEIKNLIVTNANLANATVDRLCVKGNDNKYYIIGIGTDGSLTSTEYIPTAAEIAAGETSDGRGIVITTEDVAGLDGGDVSTDGETMTAILAASIAAQKITAQEALIASASIPTLYATAIHALENTLSIIAKGVEIDADGTSVSMSGSGVRIVSRQTEIAVPSADGESDQLRVDQDGVSAEVIAAGVIRSDSVQETREGGSVTVSTAGDLAALLENLSGRYMRGPLIIDCSAITAGAFDISGVEGASITLQGGRFSRFSATECDAAIILIGCEISSASVAVSCYKASIAASGCTINAANAGGTAIGVQCVGGEATLVDCDGDCDIVAQAQYGGRIGMMGDTIPYGVLDIQGGDVYTSKRPAPRPTPPPPEPPITELTLTATATRTYNRGWTGTSLYQGSYDGEPLRMGCAWFDLTQLRGKTITSATLTFKRVSGTGAGSVIYTGIYGLNRSSASGTPTVGTRYAYTSVSGGQKLSIDFTAGAQALADNSGLYGIVFYSTDTSKVSGKTYTKGYARFCGLDDGDAPVLRVTMEG